MAHPSPHPHPRLGVLDVSIAERINTSGTRLGMARGKELSNERRWKPPASAELLSSWWPSYTRPGPLSP